MEDSNIMKIKKYVPKLPGGKEGSGYNSEERQVLESSFVDVQTAVDYETENFKYGFGYWEGSSMEDRYIKPMFQFQDPLFPIFDIILDNGRSPLLMDGINSLSGFLNDYINIPSIRSRQQIHSEFKKTLYNLFNSEFRSIDKNKSYYVNSITGLDKLTARIVDFEKDKITINLNEDVSMMSAYLTHLYNNLSYSYRDQRQMIPANLLRFNMYIKIHDVRNMPFYTPNGTGTTTHFDKSYQIYLLRDCTFDFKKTKNFDDTLTVGGFDAGAPTKPSTISIDVVYKSIEIESEYPLIRDSVYDAESSALKLNNKDKDILIYLGLNEVYINNEKSPEGFAEQIKSDSKMNNESSIESDLTNLTKNLTKTSGNVASESAQKNLKFGKVSSDTHSATREGDIKGLGKITVDKNGNEYLTYAEQDSYRTSLIDPVNGGRPYDGDVIVTKGSGQDPKWKSAHVSDTTFSQVEFKRDDNINSTGQGDYLYQPSVYKDHWNYSSDGQKPQTLLSQQRWRDSILGQINLSSFLMNLPFVIIDMFMGGYHGMQTFYIPESPNVYYGHRGTNNQNNQIPFLDGDFIGQIVPNGGITTHDTILNKDSISNFTRYIPGINIMTVDTTPPRYRPELKGRISQNRDSQIPLSGSIDTTIKTKIPLEGYIDTTPKSNDFGLGFYLYAKEDALRNTDLGSLYVGVTKENILPLTYLYTKLDKFNKLENYHTYNNAPIEIIPINEFKVNQTSKRIEPFQIEYLYNNNIDISKTLNDMLLYNNNVNKINNMTVMSVIDTIPEKPKFDAYNLYDNSVITRGELIDTYLYAKEVKSKNGELNLFDVINTKLSERGTVNLGSLYDPTSIEKLIDPIQLFEPVVAKKTVNLGLLYQNEIPVMSKLDKEEIDMTLPKKKEVELLSIDQSIINKETMTEQYINIDNNGVQKLNGESIFTDEQKEKIKLDNERLR